MLWAFDIQPAHGADGKSMIPDAGAFEGNLIIKPIPFKCRFVPRHSAVEATVGADASNAEIELMAWE